jgi:parallel beta-helix repeat protein
MDFRALNYVNYWRQNIGTDNTVNGRSVGYFWNCTGEIIDGTQYGQVIIVNCTNMTVENGVFNKTSVGIILGSSSYITIANSIVLGNTYGIYLFDSSYNIAHGNIVSGNNDGIYLRFSSYNLFDKNIVSENSIGVYVRSDSNYNLITNNTISDNNDDGLHIYDSKYNRIVNNSILENLRYGINCEFGAAKNLIYLNTIAFNGVENAIDTVGGNYWNCSGIGNLWSDYECTPQYLIPGGQDSIDYHPSPYPTNISCTTSIVTTISTTTPYVTSTPTTSSTSTQFSTEETQSYDWILILGIGLGVPAVIVTLILYRRR